MSTTAIAANKTEFESRGVLNCDGITRILENTSEDDVLRMELDADHPAVTETVDAVWTVTVVAAADAMVTANTVDGKTVQITFDPEYRRSVMGSDTIPTLVLDGETFPIARMEVVEFGEPQTVATVRQPGRRRTDYLDTGSTPPVGLTPGEIRRKSRQGKLVGSIYEGQVVYDSHHDCYKRIMNIRTSPHGGRLLALGPVNGTVHGDPGEIPVNQFAYEFIHEGRYHFCRPRKDGSPVTSTYPPSLDEPVETCRECGSTAFDCHEQRCDEGLLVKQCEVCENYGARVMCDDATDFTTGVLVASPPHVDDLTESQLRRALKNSVGIFNA